MHDSSEEGRLMDHGNGIVRNRASLPLDTRDRPSRLSKVRVAVDRWTEQYRLSEAERAILLLAAEGDNRAAIAGARACSELTIKKHISNLLQKTFDVSFHEAIERLLREVIDS